MRVANRLRHAWHRPTGWNAVLVAAQVIVVNDVISVIICQGTYQLLGVSFPPGPAHAVATWAPVVLPSILAPLASLPRVRVSYRLRLIVEQLQEEVRRREALQAELEQQATHDALTGTLNRRGFLELSADVVRPGTVLAVVDVNQFKRVNDTHGHAAGDDVLRAVSRILLEVSDQSLVGRMGGDEFVMLLPSDELTVAETVRDRLTHVPLDLPDGGTISVSASVGIGRITSGDTLDSALAVVDAAMYHAKRGPHPAGLNDCSTD